MERSKRRTSPLFLSILSFLLSFSLQEELPQFKANLKLKAEPWDLQSEKNKKISRLCFTFFNLRACQNKICQSVKFLQTLNKQGRTHENVHKYTVWRPEDLFNMGYSCICVKPTYGK